MLNDLAILYLRQDKYEQAELLYQRALAIKEKVGPEHPSTANTLDNLALLYAIRGSMSKPSRSINALPWHLGERVLGPAHPETLRTLRNYAMLLREVKRDQEAATLEAQIEARTAKEHRAQ